MENLWGSRAALLLQKGRLEEALSLLRKAQSSAQARGDLAGVGRNATNQAAVLLQLGNAEEAEENLRRAEDFFAGLQMASELAVVEGWKHRVNEARASLSA